MRPRLRKGEGSKPASASKLVPKDEPAAHQVVGRVMAYQAKDG